MPTLKEKFEAIKLSNRRFDDQICDITMDGCGSFCEFCPAKIAKTCRGCTRCEFFNNCPQEDCAKCHVRCGRHSALDMWLNDVDGVLLDEVKCPTVYCGNLPSFVPQIRDTNFGVAHSAYLISFSRFLRLVNGDVKWLYRKKKTIKEAYGIRPEDSLILHFYAKDDLLELIWRFQDADWGEGKNIWQMFADYGFDAAISVNYSCFANQPRMEHILNVKRNILSAGALSKAGIPVIVDLMWHSDVDFDRIIQWGRENSVVWYALNFQTLRKGDWTRDLILSLLDKVFKAVPGACVLANGLTEPKRIKEIVGRFGSQVVISNYGAYIKSCACLVYVEKAKTWLNLGLEKAECWQRAVELYTRWTRYEK
jgi:hypothetical protein